MPTSERAFQRLWFTLKVPAAFQQTCTRREEEVTARTCGEDHVLGDELVINDGELRQLYFIDP